MSFMKSLIGAVAFSAISVSAFADEVTLRMANWLPPAHHMQKTLADWIGAVSKATNGEVKIDLMTTPLAPPPGQYDLAKNGVVDISYGIAAFTPTKFHKFRAIETPFLFESAASGSAALHDWYTSNGFDDEEFDGTHLIASFTHAPFLVHASKEVTKLDDLKGLKIRAGGTGIEIFKKLGAAPVFLAPGDTTEALQRGTVDATQFTWESLLGFKLTDLSTHHLVFPDGGLYGTAFFVVMNEGAWNKLSEGQRAAIEGMGVEGSRIIGERWDAVESAGKAAAEKAGHTITVLSAEETARLKDEISFVEEAWISNAGGNGQALLDGLRETMKKH